MTYPYLNYLVNALDSITQHAKLFTSILKVSEFTKSFSVWLQNFAMDKAQITFIACPGGQQRMSPGK